MAERDGIRVLLADDHVLVREGLAQILEETPGMRVVGQAGDGATALTMAAELKPDLIILDYSMPNMDAAFVLEHLQRQSPQARILILTMHESIHYALRALEAGAHGYVIKSAAVQELIGAVRSVMEGEVYISPKISQGLMKHMRRPRKEREGVAALSPREFELLRALGSGMSLKECASHLNVSISSASTYRARLMEKLDLKNTAQIIRFALENEIVR